MQDILTCAPVGANTGHGVGRIGHCVCVPSAGLLHQRRQTGFEMRRAGSGGRRTSAVGALGAMLSKPLRGMLLLGALLPQMQTRPAYFSPDDPRGERGYRTPPLDLDTGDLSTTFVVPDSTENADPGTAKALQYLESLDHKAEKYRPLGGPNST